MRRVPCRRLVVISVRASIICIFAPLCCILRARIPITCNRILLHLMFPGAPSSSSLPLPLRVHLVTHSFRRREISQMITIPFTFALPAACRLVSLGVCSSVFCLPPFRPLSKRNHISPSPSKVACPYPLPPVRAVPTQALIRSTP
ncbi:hypothetical protein C8R45DRAFT_509070 [Mycena sanguinolenta]|nr:hypothetical protein C8R45DRAFT_509070 [Mycena sanguinolenta]